MNPVVNVTSTMNNVTNMFPVLVAIVGGLAAFIILLYVSSDIERFRKFKRLTKAFKYLARSLSYAAYGGLTIIVIVGSVIVLYNVAQTAQENASSIIPVLKWVGIAIGAYAGLTAIGWFMKKKVWAKIFKYHREEKLKTKYKEQMKELPVQR